MSPTPTSTTLTVVVYARESLADSLGELLTWLNAPDLAHEPTGWSSIDPSGDALVEVTLTGPDDQVSRVDAWLAADDDPEDDK